MYDKNKIHKYLLKNLWTILFHARKSARQRNNLFPKGLSVVPVPFNDKLNLPPLIWKALLSYTNFLHIFLQLCFVYLYTYI